MKAMEVRVALSFLSTKGPAGKVINNRKGVLEMGLTESEIILAKFRELEKTQGTSFGESYEDYGPWLEVFKAGWDAREKFVFDQKSGSLIGRADGA